jgi:hypothetical protein
VIRITLVTESSEFPEVEDPLVPLSPAGVTPPTPEPPLLVKAVTFTSKLNIS